MIKFLKPNRKFIKGKTLKHVDMEPLSENDGVQRPVLILNPDGCLLTFNMNLIHAKKQIIVVHIFRG